MPVVDSRDLWQRSHTAAVDEQERWRRLFADLEDELDGLTAAERDVEVSTRVRIDAGRRTLTERVVATTGGRVRIALPDLTVDAVVRDAGPDWLLLTDPTRLVALSAVRWIDGLVAPALAPPLRDGVAGRFDLRMALRRLARQRDLLRITLCDSTTHAGTIERVGADHLDLAVRPSGERRRIGVRCLPLVAVAWVALDVSR